MKRKKILVADDDAVTVKLLENNLKAKGYSVVATQNSQEVIKLVKKEQPGLILLDVMMPGKSGNEIAEVLKEDAETKHIPIIFVTSILTKEEEKEEKQDIGGNLFIAKPFNLIELLEIIRKYI